MMIMNDWQDWIVALILVLCGWQIMRGLRSFMQKMNGRRSPCSHCPGGCHCASRNSSVLYRRDISCQKEKKEKNNA